MLMRVGTARALGFRAAGGSGNKLYILGAMGVEPIERLAVRGREEAELQSRGPLASLQITMPMALMMQSGNTFPTRWTPDKSIGLDGVHFRSNGPGTTP